MSFNVDDWLKTIDIWSEEFDYVMHNSHWLFSKYNPKCPDCQAKDKLRAETNGSNFNNIEVDNKKIKIPITSEQISSPPPQDPIIIPEMTPIAPKSSLNRAFVTPQTSNKCNDTFDRTTRQSRKKLLNQTNHDLINLNETFYKSALESTPENENAHVIVNNVNNGYEKLLDLDMETNNVTQPNGTTTALPTSTTITKNYNTTVRGTITKKTSNLELLTNNDHFNLAALSKELDQIEYAQPVTSRIPRIPVKTSRY